MALKHPGEIVRNIRKQLGITQEAMAENLGVAQGRVSMAENGSNESLLRREAWWLVKEFGQEAGFAMKTIFPDEEVSNDELMEELKEIRQAIERLLKRLENKD